MYHCVHDEPYTVNTALFVRPSELEKQLQLLCELEVQTLFADEFGAVLDQLTWSSSDPEVITVSEDGVITVHKEGTAIITATNPAYPASLQIRTGRLTKLIRSLI